MYLIEIFLCEQRKKVLSSSYPGFQPTLSNNPELSTDTMAALSISEEENTYPYLYFMKTLVTFLSHIRLAMKSPYFKTMKQSLKEFSFTCPPTNITITSFIRSRTLRSLSSCRQIHSQSTKYYTEREYKLFYKAFHIQLSITERFKL